MMSKIEIFYKNLKHDDSIEEQIRQSGIIKSYILTTKTVMNQRRIDEVCLWCEETWSDDHHCENKPLYNCMFSFGEEDDGFAFVMVSKDALKPSTVISLQDEVQISCKPNLIDEICDPNPCFSHDLAPISGAPQLFDEMPIPQFILEMANIHAPNVHQVFDKMSESASTSNRESVCSKEVLVTQNEEVETQGYGIGDIQVSDRCVTQKFGLDDHYFCLAQPIPIDEVYLWNGPNMLDEMTQNGDGVDKGLVVAMQYDTILGKYELFDDGDGSRVESTSALNYGIKAKFRHHFHLLGLEYKIDLSWDEKNRELEGLRLNINGSMDFSVLVYDPGELCVHINVAEFTSYTMLFELQGGWKANINYKEVQSWSKLIVRMVFWRILAIVIELPSFQIDVICPRIDAENLHGVVQSYFDGLFNVCVFNVVDVEIVSVSLCRRKRVALGCLARSLITFEMCAKPSVIILTLEDKGVFTGAGEKVYAKHTRILCNPLALRSGYVSISTCHHDMWLPFVVRLALCKRRDDIEGTYKKLSPYAMVKETSYKNELIEELISEGISCENEMMNLVSRPLISLIIERSVNVPKAYWILNPGIRATKQLESCVCRQLKEKVHENYQFFLFDPGGSSMVRAGNNMVTNSSYGRCSLIFSFKYCTIMILEDKDRFKGSVMMHVIFYVGVL